MVWFHLSCISTFTGICFIAFKLRLHISSCASRPQSSKLKIPPPETQEISNSPAFKRTGVSLRRPSSTNLFAKPTSALKPWQPKTKKNATTTARREEEEEEENQENREIWGWMAPAPYAGPIVSNAQAASKTRCTLHPLSYFLHDLIYHRFSKHCFQIHPVSQPRNLVVVFFCVTETKFIEPPSFARLSPIFYLISTPPGARCFLGSLRLQGRIEVGWGTSAAMVTSYTTCLLSGWDRQNWHVCVCACKYVRTYIIYIHDYIYIYM